MKHHLANLQPRIQRQIMKSACIFEFKREFAAMPTWITESSKKMLIPFTCAA